MAVPPHHFDDEPAENQPGGLLDALERRQNDVLGQLDDLDAKLSEVLKGLESTPIQGVGGHGFNTEAGSNVAGEDDSVEDSRVEDSRVEDSDDLALEDWA